MTAHQKLTPQSAQDVTAIVMSLPVSAQIDLMLAVLNGRDFTALDGDEIDRAECALVSLQSQSREMDYHQDRALHGAGVWQ
jgi:hypothetical protein